MLDRVTPRPKMREELITITRMLLNLPPAIAGDLPPPDAATDAQTPDTADKPPAPAEATAKE